MGFVDNNFTKLVEFDSIHNILGYRCIHCNYVMGIKDTMDSQHLMGAECIGCGRDVIEVIDKREFKNEVL